MAHPDVDQQIDEEQRAHLASGVLHLPTPKVILGSQGYAALTQHAVPIIDFLVQIDDAGVERTNPVLADFTSGLNFDDAQTWHNDLAHTLTDLAHTAGLQVSVPQTDIDTTQWQYPELIRSLIDSSLPPALGARINARRGELTQELDAEIERRKQESKKRPFIVDLFRSSNLLRRNPKPPASTPTFNYGLKIAAEDITGMRLNAPTTFKHTVSLVPPVPAANRR